MEIVNVWVITEELNQMRSYLEYRERADIEFEKLMENKYSVEELERIVAANPSDPISIEYERYIDTFQSLYGDYQRRYNCSFLVSWYSFVEYNLLRLCNDCGFGTESKMKRPNKGIRLGNELLGYQNIPITGSDWSELVLINKIRNQIAHNGGLYSIQRSSIKSSTDQNNYELLKTINKDKNLIEYLGRKNLIRLSEDVAYIFPDSNYCDNLIGFGKRIFEKLFLAIGLTLD
jgi:hypothetical protein